MHTTSAVVMRCRASPIFGACLFRSAAWPLDQKLTTPFPQPLLMNSDFSPPLQKIKVEKYRNDNYATTMMLRGQEVAETLHAGKIQPLNRTRLTAGGASKRRPTRHLSAATPQRTTASAYTCQSPGSCGCAGKRVAATRQQRPPLPVLQNGRQSYRTHNTHNRNNAGPSQTTMQQATTCSTAHMHARSPASGCLPHPVHDKAETLLKIHTMSYALQHTKDTDRDRAG